MCRLGTRADYTCALFLRIITGEKHKSSNRMYYNVVVSAFGFFFLFCRPTVCTYIHIAWVGIYAFMIYNDRPLTGQTTMMRIKQSASCYII